MLRLIIAFVDVNKTYLILSYLIYIFVHLTDHDEKQTYPSTSIASVGTSLLNHVSVRQQISILVSAITAASSSVLFVRQHVGMKQMYVDECSRTVGIEANSIFLSVH